MCLISASSAAVVRSRAPELIRVHAGAAFSIARIYLAAEKTTG
jgi:hypothetical protein